jgi:dCTP deaminase
MFLNSEEILERMSKGDLVIEPLLPEAVGIWCVDLRVGTEFVPYPTFAPGGQEVAPDRAVTVELGKRIVLQPHSGLVAASLEFVKIPADLCAFVFPRTTWSRVGMEVSPFKIDPGYAGRLTLPVRNVGDVTVFLYPGLRVVGVSFAHIRQSARVSTRAWQPLGDYNLAMSEDETSRLNAILSGRAVKLKARSDQQTSVASLISQVLEASGIEKGRALERMAAELFQTIEGIKVLKTNARLQAEELDVVVQNDNSDRFWRFLGSPIIIECKNWSRKVGASEISVLFDKLESLSPDAHTGIIIAPNGVSGDSYRDAILKIREKRQRGRYLIVLSREDLEEIANGTHAALIIERKYNELLLI